MVKMRKTVSIMLAFIFIFVSIITPFAIIFVVGTFLPSQYSDTYYGELAAMYSHVKNAEGKKIIFIGNSGVAFGIDSALAEELLSSGGMEYTVCNFGLYGALGTSMMLQLAENCIGEGDIVILSPELEEQALSLYFSAEDAWYAFDSDLSMFFGMDFKYQRKLIGGYTSYAAAKYSLYKGGTSAKGSGVYAANSFDAHCDLKNCDRSYNLMDNGVDSNRLVALNSSVYAADFLKYVNEYAVRIMEKGAQMWYSFAPLNQAAVLIEEQGMDEFYADVLSFFDFPVINGIEDCLMEKEWFYDSNYHLNEYGMIVYTVQMVNDIKNQLGNTTKTEAVLPNKPVIPQKDITGEGDNACADMFTYEQDDGYYVVTGITEAGSKQKNLVVPYQVDGLYIKSFSVDAFVGNTVVESITLQSNITLISDGSFDGCTALTAIILKHGDPSEISVGYGLLNGTASNCTVYVTESALSRFKNNYFWGRYAKRLEGY